MGHLAFCYDVTSVSDYICNQSLADLSGSTGCLPTGDQEVVGSILAGSATFFRGELIMKYFLLSFSPFR